MGTKAQNDDWRKRVDQWEENAMVDGIRAARVFADQAKAWTP